MDLDGLDIYEDLDDFHEDETKKTKELVEWETKYNDALQTIEELRKENKQLGKTIKRIEINFQSLLDTAKTEIQRKDQQIATIRKEKDDICFRRRQRSDDNASKGTFKSSIRHGDVDVESTYFDHSKKYTDKFDLKCESTRSLSRKSRDQSSEKHSRGSKNSQKRDKHDRPYSNSNTVRETSNQRDKHYSKNTKCHNSNEAKDKPKDSRKKSTNRDSRRESTEYERPSRRRDRSREQREKKDVDKNIANREHADGKHIKERKRVERHGDTDELCYAKNSNKHTDGECSSGSEKRRSFNGSNSILKQRKRKRKPSSSSTPSNDSKQWSSRSYKTKSNDYRYSCDKFDSKEEKSQLKDTHDHSPMVDDYRTMPNSTSTDADYNNIVKSNCHPVQVDTPSVHNSSNGAASINTAISNELCSDHSDTDENFNIPDLSTPKKVELFNTIFNSHTENLAENSDGNSALLSNIMHILCNTNQVDSTSSIATASAEGPSYKTNKSMKQQPNLSREESGVSECMSIMQPSVDGSQEEPVENVDLLIDVADSTNGSRSSRSGSKKNSHDQTSTSAVKRTTEKEVADKPMLEGIVADEKEETIIFNVASSTCTTTRKERIQILEDIRLPSVFDVGTHVSNDATTTLTVSTTNEPTSISTATSVQHKKQSTQPKICTTDCVKQVETITANDTAVKATTLYVEIEDKTIDASSDVQDVRLDASTQQPKTGEDKKLVDAIANYATGPNAQRATATLVKHEEEHKRLLNDSGEAIDKAKTVDGKHTRLYVRKRKIIIRPDITTAPCVIDRNEQLAKKFKPSTETVTTSAGITESDEKQPSPVTDRQDQITESPTRRSVRRRKCQDNQCAQLNASIEEDGSAKNEVPPIVVAVQSSRPVMNSSYDDKLNELDLRLQSMFESPPRASDVTTIPMHDIPNVNVSDNQYNHNDKVATAITAAAESTMSEVINKSKCIDSEQSAVNEASTLNSSLHETKRISLGCSDYRVEKVSDNVVNVFITRKHARRKIVKKKLQEVVATSATATRSTLT